MWSERCLVSITRDGNTMSMTFIYIGLHRDGFFYSFTSELAILLGRQAAVRRRMFSVPLHLAVADMSLFLEIINNVESRDTSERRLRTQRPHGGQPQACKHQAELHIDARQAGGVKIKHPKGRSSWYLIPGTPAATDEINVVVWEEHEVIVSRRRRSSYKG